MFLDLVDFGVVVFSMESVIPARNSMPRLRFESKRGIGLHSFQPSLAPVLASCYSSLCVLILHVCVSVCVSIRHHDAPIHRISRSLGPY